MGKRSEMEVRAKDTLRTKTERRESTRMNTKHLESKVRERNREKETVEEGGRRERRSDE